LDVSLSVNTVQKMPGKYCEFNDLFWPGHEACDKDFKPAEKRERSKPEISLTSMVVATHGIPDVDKRFVLPITSKVTVDSSDSIDLTESGSVTGRSRPKPTVPANWCWALSIQSPASQERRSEVQKHPKYNSAQTSVSSSMNSRATWAIQKISTGSSGIFHSSMRNVKQHTPP